MQQIIVILVVAACLVWLGFYGYRVLVPRKGKACGGSCCDASEPLKPEAQNQGAQTVFFRSEDLVARVKARKS